VETPGQQLTNLSDSKFLSAAALKGLPEHEHRVKQSPLTAPAVPLTAACTSSEDAQKNMRAIQPQLMSAVALMLTIAE